MCAVKGFERREPIPQVMKRVKELEERALQESDLELKSYLEAIAAKLHDEAIARLRRAVDSQSQWGDIYGKQR